MALLICDAVAPGPRVAQTVVRLGIPPGTPVNVQLYRRAPGIGSANAVDAARSNTSAPSFIWHQPASSNYLAAVPAKASVTAGFAHWLEQREWKHRPLLPWPSGAGRRTACSLVSACCRCSRSRPAHLHVEST